MSFSRKSIRLFLRASAAFNFVLSVAGWLLDAEQSRFTRSISMS
jgi:hypothetical protein